MFYAWIKTLVRECKNEVSPYTIAIRNLASYNSSYSMYLIYYYNPADRSELYKLNKWVTD